VEISTYLMHLRKDLHNNEEDSYSATGLIFKFRQTRIDHLSSSGLRGPSKTSHYGLGLMYAGGAYILLAIRHACGLYIIGDTTRVREQYGTGK
jgi:hypothetical protein